MRPLVLSLCFFLLAACGQTQPVNIPVKTSDKPGPKEAVADFAEGCFWHTEIVFQSLEGVRDAVSGYSGGTDAHPDYEKVCTGTTGHAETVQVYYDPSKISFATLVRAFFASMDPTELDRQGPDVGRGYRSDIFYVNDAQRRIAQAYIAQLDKSKVFSKPIVTRVDALPAFNPVELSQQDFMIKNPQLDYIRVNDVPKLASLKQLFPASFNSMPREYR